MALTTNVVILFRIQRHSKCLYECNIARDCKQGFAINKIVFFLNNLQFLLYKAEWVCSFQQRNNGSNMKAGLDSPLSVE